MPLSTVANLAHAVRRGLDVPPRPLSRMRALIADHHEPTRRQLRAMLCAAHDIDVVGTIASGVQLADALNGLSPNLLFFEPRLPGADGLRVLDELEVDRLAVTIVVTTDHQYALQAFDRHVLDYLVKPIVSSRLEIAMARARRRLYTDFSDRLTTGVLAMVAGASGPPADDRLIVRSQGRAAVVEVGHVDWVEANGNYPRLHCGPASYPTRETLSVLLHRLGNDRFLRIHRSCIVRLDAIRELRATARREHEVVLVTGTRLPVGDRYRTALKARLAGR